MALTKVPGNLLNANLADLANVSSTSPSTNQVLKWNGSTWAPADDSAPSGTATESYVNTQISNLVDSSPSALNTLNELAAALGDDANFSTTITNSIATKLPLAGGTLTGALTLGGNLNVGSYDIVTSSNGNIDLDPHGSGKVVFKGNSTRGAGQFVLNCENNSHGITIKGPPHSAGASYTLTLPNDDGSSNQVLKTDGSGNLSWTTVATLTDSQTLTNKTLTSPDINSPDIDGGAIDGAVIGGATPAAGSFTTIAASGNVDFNANVDVDGTLETDALTINGVTSVPFEAADHSKLDGIEANADVTDATNVTAAGALMDSELTSIASVKALNQGVATTDSPTFAGITTTADISLGDNDKAVFGAGSDLQIYHDGSNSRVNDNGTGSLQLQTGGSTKLEVLSTGVDVTGLVNLDNLTINGAQGSDGQVLTSTGSGVQWEDSSGGVDGIGSSTTTQIITLSSANKVGIGQNVGNAGALLHVYQASGSGDLFKVQTGSGTHMLMDSSGNLGIGTSSPSQTLDVNGTVELNNLTVGGSQGSDGQVLTSTGSGVQWENAGGVNGVSSFTSTTALTLMNSSPPLVVLGSNFGTNGFTGKASAQVYQSDNTTYSGSGFTHQTGEGGLVIQNASTTTSSMAGISFVNGPKSGNGHSVWNNYSVQTSTSGKSDLVWATRNSGTVVFEAMRLVHEGANSTNPRLGIGTNSPTETLDVDGNIKADGHVNALSYRINGSQGSDGQVLTSTGSGVAWEDSSGGIANISEDSTPQLGGTLETQGYNINANSGNLVLQRGGTTKFSIKDDYIEINRPLVFNFQPEYGTGAMDEDSIYIGNTNTGYNLDHDQVNNIIIGHSAAQYIIEADYNVLIGSFAGRGDNNYPTGTELDESVGIGYNALRGASWSGGSQHNSIGNVAVGYGALSQIGAGDYNVGIGHQAGERIRTGYNNVTIGGREAGDTIQSGNDNIIIGFRADVATESQQHSIVMGNLVTAAGNNTFTFGNGSTDSSVSFGATSITAPSDERYKEEITDSTAGLSFINDLRPVTFKWKKEKDIPTTQKAYVEGSETRVVNDKINHGFIAQEVKAAIDSHPEIKEGFDMWKEDEADGRQRLGPGALIPMLVKAVQELSAENAALAARIEALE